MCSKQVLFIPSGVVQEKGRGKKRETRLLVRQSQAQRDALMAVAIVKDAGGRKTAAIPPPGGGAAPVWERKIPRHVAMEESRGCMGLLCRCCIIVSYRVSVRDCRKTARYRMGLVPCAVAYEDPCVGLLNAEAHGVVCLGCLVSCLCCFSCPFCCFTINCVFFHKSEEKNNYR